MICWAEESKNMGNFLALFPIELSRNIVGYLDGKSLCHGAQVSRTWRKIINTEYLMWKRRFDIDGFVFGEGELERAGFDEMDTGGLLAMRLDCESLVSSNPTSQYSNFVEELAKIEGPYAASLYWRHYLIRKDWMGDIKPRYIAICVYPRNRIICLQFDTEKILSRIVGFAHLWLLEAGRVFSCSSQKSAVALHSPLSRNTALSAVTQPQSFLLLAFLRRPPP